VTPGAPFPSCQHSPGPHGGVLAWAPHGGGHTATGHPVPAASPVPGAAFPHPALVLCLLVVVLVVAVVAPPRRRRDDSAGLARGVVRGVLCGGEKNGIRDGLGKK